MVILWMIQKPRKRLSSLERGVMQFTFLIKLAILLPPHFLQQEETKKKEQTRTWKLFNAQLSGQSLRTLGSSILFLTMRHWDRHREVTICSIHILVFHFNVTFTLLTLAAHML